MKYNDAMIIFHKNIELLGLADKSIYYFRAQQYDKALTLVIESIDLINDTVEAILNNNQYFNTVSKESLLEMLTGILQAKRNKDYLLLADLFEMQLISFLCSIQELIIQKEEFVYNKVNYDKNLNLLSRMNPSLYHSLQEPINPANLLAQSYRVEFSSCGLMTLGAENKGDKFYFHTNNQITNEAFILAKHWYKESTLKYVVYGLGFGYHIAELKKLAPTAKIEVYESDCNVLQLACAFTDIMPLLEDPNISIIYDPDHKWLLERLQTLEHNNDFKIHLPSLKNVKDKAVMKMLEGYVPCARIFELC